MATKTIVLTSHPKHHGKLDDPLHVPAIEATQGPVTLYAFKASASALFRSFSINRKIEDKEEGYQRALSPSRVEALSRYVASGQPIPGAIIICLDKSCTFDAKQKTLTIPSGTDRGWVIDGQHRLAGAARAAKDGHDIDLFCVSFIGLSTEKQIDQFVTINREGKNVPTSLYLSLLKHLPRKNQTDAPKERAADLASELKKDEKSPFFQRIVSTVAPKDGQISLVNFSRKVAPLLALDRGTLHLYNYGEQKAVISNYYAGFAQVFPDQFDSKGSVFFKTIGFGALFNILPVFFNLTLKTQGGFEVKDVVAMLKKMSNFDFAAWSQLGTGTAAENLAGNDFKASLLWAFKEKGRAANSLRV
jgi:DGQHR domain-containing protein